MQKYKEIATHFQIIAPPFALSYFYDNVILLMLSYIVMETSLRSCQASFSIFATQALIITPCIPPQ